jgi:hypothetical protein
MRTALGRRFGTLAVALAVAATGLVVAATPANAACQTVRIWSTDNYQYVAVEKDYPDIYKGVLRARTPANAAGTWELFDMCFISGYTFTLRAWANGLYVAREANYSGRFSQVLRARTPAGQLGTWEQFTLQEPGGDVHGILGSNGRFVAYERDYNDAYDNLLRARTAGERGPWEAFTYQAV